MQLDSKELETGTQMPTLSSEPRVLVIVPAYNEALTLPTLIQKLTAQYPFYDIAVIDDGSKDDTANAVRGTGAGRSRRLVRR